MKRLEQHAIIAAALLGIAAASASAGQVCPKLTRSGLGLGAGEFNAGSVVEPDVIGKLVTSVTVGEGSILTIQANGLAGPGTLEFPLMTTVTARTRSEATGLPAMHDYQAGIIYLSAENGLVPDGRDEGLGVRAYTVTGATALRQIDGATGRALIEGSLEVSGGTNAMPDYDPMNPNGGPYFDESVIFDFNPALEPRAILTTFTLSKFVDAATGQGSVIRLRVGLVGGMELNANLGLPFDTNNAAFFEPISAADGLWRLKLSGFPQLDADSILDYVTISADDPQGGSPPPDEHFLIPNFCTTIIPEPGTLALLACGAVLFRRRRPKE